MFTQYTPSIEADLKLLEWWHTLAVSGDLERAFSVTMAPCGTFMAEMRKCLVLVAADEQGWWAVAWFDQALGGGFHHFWLRPDKRHTKDGLRALIVSLEHGLRIFPVLLSTTKEPCVPSQIQRLGFQTLGTVPHLFDNLPCTISWLDEAHFREAVGERYSRLVAFDEPAQEVA